MQKQHKLLVVTAMWGDWHISKYLELNLPTLLAEGNFPALSGYCDIAYFIYTSQGDMKRIQDAPGVQALSRFVRVEFCTIGPDIIADPIAAHHAVWAEVTKRAKNEKSLILLMPPDVAWSNGSFEHVGRLLEAGKKAIFMAFLRADSESFAPALGSYGKFGGQEISVSGAQMVEICMRTLHPLMAAYLRDSSHFPIHPEMMLWAVPGEGLLCRILAREMFVYDPSMVALNTANLLATNLDPALIHVVDDSDDLFAVSLAPFHKEFEWYRWPRAADHVVVSDWWLDYDSWINDLIAGTKVRWHFRPVTEKAWQAREQGADVFLRRAAALREGRRLFRTAHLCGCTTAASMIAVATQSGLMSRIARGRGGALVFIPINEAFSDYPQEFLDQLLEVAGERDLAQLMSRHFISGTLPIEPRRLAECLGLSKSIDMIAADGTRLQIVRRGGKLTVNDVRVLDGPIQSGKNSVYLVESLLDSLGRSDLGTSGLVAHGSVR